MAENNAGCTWPIALGLMKTYRQPKTSGISRRNRFTRPKMRQVSSVELPDGDALSLECFILGVLDQRKSTTRLAQTHASSSPTPVAEYATQKLPPKLPCHVVEDREASIR